MSEAVLIDAIRTPFGRRLGALRHTRPDALLANLVAHHQREKVGQTPRGRHADGKSVGIIL